MEPTVLAKFSSNIVPPMDLRSAIPMTAAGYVAAIVIPAFNPRYAFAAPRITDITSPMINARTVNSAIFVSGETKGTKGLLSDIIAPLIKKLLNLAFSAKLSFLIKINLKI